MGVLVSPCARTSTHSLLLGVGGANLPAVGKVRRFAPYLGLGTVVLGLLVYLGISYRVADGVTKLERQPLSRAAETVGQVHEDVSFRARDGLLLKGWWFDPSAWDKSLARPDKAIVFVHGRGQNRIVSSFRPDLIAKIFLARGWDVLLFDLRGHGQSEGDRYSLGQYEPRDIAAAVDFASAKGGLDRRRVALIGESLGGGSAIMTVGLDPSIGPVVTDSAYADGYTVVSESHMKYTGLPSWFAPGIAVTSLLFGLNVWSVRPSDVVRAHPERAWLFIQCDADTTVFEHHGRDLKAASANPGTEFWVVHGCEHVKAFTEHPEEWQQHAIAFLDRELAKTPAAAR